MIEWLTVAAGLAAVLVLGILAARGFDSGSPASPQPLAQLPCGGMVGPHQPR